MFVYAGSSACGYSHTCNDDRVFVVEDVLHDAEEPSTESYVCGYSERANAIIAAFDGVSASNQGFRAAEAGAQSLSHTVAKGEGIDLAECVQRCSDDVVAWQKDEPVINRSFTVGAGLMLYRGETGIVATTFHMGDCRVYRFRNGRVTRLTKDHTLAEHYRNRHGKNALVPPEISSVVITYAGGEIVHPFELGEPIPVKDGDLYLACSDGMWNHMPKQRMLEILSDVDPKVDETLQIALERLTRAAQAGASLDDISGALLAYVDVHKCEQPSLF